jgi:hypothetical protein
MNKNTTYTILAVVIVLILGLFLVGIYKNQSESITSYEECVSAGNDSTDTIPPVCVTDDGKTFVQTPKIGTIGTPVKDDISNLIQVDSINMNDEVKSPLTITGKARGTFYFEASFPVKLIDASGKVLAQAPAQAQGEWMTNEFVPFKATLNFTSPTQGGGILIFKNDNPSGLTDNDREFRIPIKFVPTQISGDSKFDTNIGMKIGTKITFPDTLVVELEAIEDSRCKPDVVCIWAGELNPVLRVGKARSEVRLGTTTKQSVTFGNYTFTLNSAIATTANITVKKNN